MNGVFDTAIYNNIFTYAQGDAIGIQSQSVNSDNIHIVHNTFYGVNQTNYDAMSQVGVAGATGLVMRNNIFYNDYDIANFDMDVFNNDSSLWPNNAYNVSYDGSGQVASHNLFFIGVTTTNIINHAGTKYAFDELPPSWDSASGWLDGTGITAATLIADLSELPFAHPPVFDASHLPITDHAGYNPTAHAVAQTPEGFRLRAGTAAIGTGLCVGPMPGITHSDGIDADFFGKPRGSICDLGPIQH
jgi:hypothetical protein